MVFLGFDSLVEEKRKADEKALASLESFSVGTLGILACSMTMANETITAD